MNLDRALTRIIVATLLIFGSYLLAHAQPDSVYRLPVGTRIRLRMDAEVNSKVSSQNDTFTTTIARPVLIRETIVLPVGTIIEGRVSNVVHAASGGKAGTLDLVFETLKFSSDVRRSIDGVLVDKPRTSSGSTFNVLSIVGGAAIGGIVGAVSKSTNGTLVGAGIGAGVGTGIAFARKGKEVRIGKNFEFEIELRKEVILPVLDY